jgi:uracil phosphoribosyltransferase
MSALYVSNHPLIMHKLGLLRDENTKTADFRKLISEITMLICYEASADLPLKDSEVKTPVCNAKTKEIGIGFTLIPILRAGIGMAEGMLNLLPDAKTGHVGLYRDPKTLRPVEYYCKLPPDINRDAVFILDPMLATGGTANMAIQFLKEKGAENIKLICIIACPEGVKTVNDKNPDVDIYSAVCDERLNDFGYIVPGLGDAGDRLFGTE